MLLAPEVDVHHLELGDQEPRREQRPGQVNAVPDARTTDRKDDSNGNARDRGEQYGESRDAERGTAHELRR